MANKLNNYLTVYDFCEQQASKIEIAIIQAESLKQAINNHIEIFNKEINMAKDVKNFILLGTTAYKLDSEESYTILRKYFRKSLVSSIQKGFYSDFKFEKTMVT